MIIDSHGLFLTVFCLLYCSAFGGEEAMPINLRAYFGLHVVENGHLNHLWISQNAKWVQYTSSEQRREKVNYHLLCVNTLLQAETRWVIVAFCLLSV